MLSATDVRKAAAYAALVVLLVGATLSGGAIFFAVTEHAGHAHVGLVGWRAILPTLVDSLGLVLMVLVAIQMMVGYRLFAVAGKKFRPVHVSLAWTLVALMAVHMAGGIYHTVTTGIEPLPLWINVAGLATLGLLAAQVASGYAEPKRKRLRRVHLYVAAPIALVVSAHAVLGVLHTLVG